MKGTIPIFIYFTFCYFDIDKAFDIRCNVFIKIILEINVKANTQLLLVRLLINVIKSISPEICSS